MFLAYVSVLCLNCCVVVIPCNAASANGLVRGGGAGALKNGNSLLDAFDCGIGVILFEECFCWFLTRDFDIEDMYLARKNNSGRLPCDHD